MPARPSSRSGGSPRRGLLAGAGRGGTAAGLRRETRQAIPKLRNVVVALVTRTVRGIETEARRAREALGVVDAQREVDRAVALRGGCRFDRRLHRPAHVAGIPGRIDDRHQVDVGAPVDVLLEWIRLPPRARDP